MTVLSVAPTLDLSRLPAPQAISALSYEDLLAARLASLRARFQAAGIEYDVSVLETDPGVILQQEDTYRQLLDLARINDAVRAVMIAFAVGSDLDHLGAFYGAARGVVTPANGATPAVMESDADFRARVLLAPEAFACAGSVGGYAYHALSADPANVRFADVWSPGPGEVAIAIQSRAADGIATQATLDRVAAHIARPDVKALTDVVNIRSVSVLPYEVDVTCLVLPGPDPITVKAVVEASLAKMTAERFSPTRDVPISAVMAAAMVGPVDRVIVRSPTNHIARERGESARCIAVKVAVETYDG